MIRYKLFLISMLFIHVAAFAGPGAPPQTPIDGGLGALLTLGIVYGIRRMTKRKSKL